MYYKSVNRGVFLTSPGRYTIGLVMALGLIAIASSYNGIYLAVSLGMSILIVSGLLSEKVMRYYELVDVAPVIAEPHTPFSVRFRASNQSDELNLYGIENLVLPPSDVLPRITEKTVPLMRSIVVTLTPASNAEVSGTCSGLPRGLYKEFTVLQRTLYPFGLLAKFKLSELSTHISILPGYDETLANRLREEIQRRITGNGIDQQFHSHRPYTARDSLRDVDWKKSAGREQGSWVLKVYESFVEDFGILLSLDWSVAANCPDEASYELHLTRLRTVCEVVRETGRRLLLSDDEMVFWSGYDACVAALVQAPKFEDRHLGIVVPATEITPGAYLQLSVGSPNPVWGKEPVRVYA